MIKMIVKINTDLEARLCNKECDETGSCPHIDNDLINCVDDVETIKQWLEDNEE